MQLEVRKNYLFKDNAPFFWLADTAWLLFEKLNFEEAKNYLNHRKRQGFTVIQCVLIHTFQNGYSIAGKSPLDKGYWHEVADIVSYTQSIGLVLGILPMWGGMVKNGVIHENNIDIYADFLIRFFAPFDHIVWILGGDIRGDDYFHLYDSLGKKLKTANPVRLITFHPFGRTGSYQWFKDCSWIDFHMFQSGHRRYDQLQMNAWDDKLSKEDFFGEDNYKYVIKNRSITTKPCLDAEPSYEGILQGLHDPAQPYWQDYDVRRYAYWSLLEGACGFTYGNNAVMQFHRKEEEGSYGVKEEWQEALDMPGGKQMHILKELMLELDFTEGMPRDDMVVNPKPFYEHISVFTGKNYILCYTYLGNEFSLYLKEKGNKIFQEIWINPENGERNIGKVIKGKEEITIKPDKRSNSNDWILLLVQKNEESNLM